MFSKTILLALAASAIVAAAPAPMADASAVSEPEARWHSGFRVFPGQPISKREAEAAPEALVNTEGKVLPAKKGGH